MHSNFPAFEMLLKEKERIGGWYQRKKVFSLCLTPARPRTLADYAYTAIDLVYFLEYQNLSL